MAGPPADSREIDEAVDEHSLWCPDSQDWANEAIDGQQIERDRIIGRIRETFPQHHADFIVAAITSTTKSDPVIRQDTGAAQDQTTSKEIKPMDKPTTDSTASAWCPLWCTSTHEDDWIDDSEEPTRHHTRLIGTMRTADMHPRASDIEVEIVQDETSGTTTSPYVSFYGDLNRDLSLADIDNMTTLLARARQRLIETGEV